MKQNIRVLVLGSLSVFSAFNVTIAQENLAAKKQEITAKVTNSSFCFTTPFFHAWDNAFVYKRSYGTNLGIVSFKVLGENHFAFLSESSSKIITSLNGSIENSFSIAANPRDFTYLNNAFYVLYENVIIAYNSTGSIVKQIPFSKDYTETQRITSNDKNLYIVLSDGNSVLLERNNDLVNGEIGLVEKGYSSNEFNKHVELSLNQDNTYFINSNHYPQKSYSNANIRCPQKVAGAYLIGTKDNKVVVDEQLFANESPVEITRYISVYDTKNKYKKLASIQMPNMYYAYTNEDFDIDTDGNIYNMITAPEGIYIFKLTIASGCENTDYPKELKNTTYHFNTDVLPVD